MELQPLKILSNRLGMLLTISLFIPTIFSAFKGNTDQLNGNVLSWSIVIMFLVSCYLLVEILNTKIHKILLLMLNCLVIINIGLFLPIFYIIAENKDLLYGKEVIIFRYSLLTAELMPLVMLIVLFIQFLVIICKWADKYISVTARKLVERLTNKNS